MLGHVLGLRARLQPGFPWMPEDLQIPQIWTSAAWLDRFKAVVSKKGLL